MTYAFANFPASLVGLLQRSIYAVRELPGVVAVDAAARHAHYSLVGSPAMSVRRGMLRQHLAGLHQQWSAATRYSSSLADRQAHPAYSSILEMGDEAIPLILESIASQPSFLVMALHDITGEDPVLPEHHGRMADIVHDWLRWGTERGYRQ